jgi:two-component system response regulator YesN
VYKVLLVDDEAVVREGIKDRIQWSELGLDCIGDCENGMEAMEAVDRLRPDIVLTDINMPFVDGLELTRYIMEHYPLTKMIILTGFDEFTYAQQAIKLRVHDFILKPITAAELKKVLEKVKAEIDGEKRKREDLDRLQKQLNESLPLLKERFLERLATSSVRSKEAAERLDYFNIMLPGPSYIALSVDIDQFPEDYGRQDKELMRFAVYNVVQEVAERENGSAVFRNRDERMLVLLSGEEDSLYDQAQWISENIRQLIEEYFKFTVTVGVGRVGGSLAELPFTYESALSALEYRFLLGINKVISIMDMEGNRARSTSEEEQQEQERVHKLTSCMKTGTELELKEAVEEVINHYRTAFPSMKQCYTHIQRLIITVIRAIDDLGLKEEDVFGKGVNPITHIYAFQTLEELEEWLHDHCRDAVRQIVANRNDFCENQVRNAVAYLKEHYPDAELSLAKVCRHVHMSTSYFSSVFKTRTGKTFIEYLTGARMEKARELLKLTTLKTYEIAAKVGYQDPHYFSILFKKHTGDTPTEYRQKSSADAR